MPLIGERTINERTINERTMNERTISPMRGIRLARGLST